MSIRQLVKKSISKSCMATGVYSRKLNSLQPTSILILTYHRVLPLDLVPPQTEPGMYVSPEVLLKNIKFLKRYFSIISMTEAQNILSGNIAPQGTKPFCVLTFDDGWLDYYQYAWPVLRREEVDSIVYLPTGLIGTTKVFWTDRLLLMLSSGGIKTFKNNIEDQVLNQRLSNVKSTDHQLSILIDFFKTIPYSQIDLLLSTCEEDLGISKNIKRSFMDWDEVRRLHRSGLVSFGSHTKNHEILTTISKDKIYKELILSKQKLLDERVVKNDIHFCYPNGNYTREIVNTVKAAGYSSAVSCDSGWNKIGSDLFSLKRVSLHQDISLTECLLTYHILGRH